jgi:hypothetical protein
VPDRYLRGQILRSDRFNACSVDARELFYRMISIVDDFGCYDGRPGVIASAAFPLGRYEPIALEELHRAGLVVKYTNAGKPYIALMQWGEIRRGSRKYPAPPICNELRDVTYQGFFGNPMVWRNPRGCDHVSVLVDVNGNPMVPQPAEWRDAKSTPPYMPSFYAAQLVAIKARKSARGPQPEQDDQAMVPNLSTSAYEPQPVPQPEGHVTGTSARGTVSTNHRSSTHQSSNTPMQLMQPVQPVAETAPQPEGLNPTAATPPNGIRLINGKLEGLDDGRLVLQWQGAFAEVSVPKQLDRIGAWLSANPEALGNIERGIDSFESFIVRWLIKETRGTVTTKARVDA